MAGRQRSQQGRDRAHGLSLGLLPGLLGYNLRRAQTAVFQNFREIVGAKDVTPGQMGVLVLIDQNPGISQSRLGEALGIDRSTMVALVDRLERRGVVDRVPSTTDRRSYALRLTPAGRRLLAELVPLVEAHERAIKANLSPEEQTTLNELLARLHAAHAPSPKGKGPG